VDSVSEVIDIKDLDIWDTPAFGAALNTEYIPQMAQMGGE
jgi:purine-binding chemotaxis protein CheW